MPIENAGKSVAEKTMILPPILMPKVTLRFADAGGLNELAGEYAGRGDLPCAPSIYVLRFITAKPACLLMINRASSRF